MCGGEGEGEEKVVEQQMGALGNPCSSFSSSSHLLCIRRGFDKNFTLGSAAQWEYINRSQIHARINWERGRAVSFLGIYVSNFQYSVSYELTFKDQR